METDPNPPSFNLQYNVAPLNLGEDYAKGMAAGQSVGQDIGKGISSAFDVMTRNQTADQTLMAMQQNKMLTPDQYNAVAGKSLGAKENLLGMYAGQWLADQAQQRALALQQGKGAVDIGVEHAKLLDTINAVKGGYGTAAGVNQRNLQAPVPPVAPLVGPSGALPTPRGATPQIQAKAAALAGSGAAPTSLGSGNIYSPGPKLGAPVPRKGTPIPPGATIVAGTGPKGEQAQFLRYPDGTLSPIQQ